MVMKQIKCSHCLLDANSTFRRMFAKKGVTAPLCAQKTVETR